MDAIGPDEDITFDSLLILYPYDDLLRSGLNFFDSMLPSDVLMFPKELLQPSAVTAKCAGGGVHACHQRVS